MNDYLLTHHAETPRLGDYVRTDHHGHMGRVTEVHHLRPQGAGWQDWLAAQSIPIPPEMIEKPWVSVLVHEGGSVIAPGSLCTVVEPFPFTNDYAPVYFRDAMPPTAPQAEPGEVLVTVETRCSAMLDETWTLAIPAALLDAEDTDAHELAVEVLEHDRWDDSGVRFVSVSETPDNEENRQVRAVFIDGKEVDPS